MVRIVLPWALLVAAGAAQAEPAQPAGPRPFCRFVERDDGGRVDVLLATYRKGDAELTLFAALHIADREHYADLQRRFAACDALLYELIADPELRPYPGMEGLESDGVSWFQAHSARALGLTYQGDAIDYRPANFVHADLTASEWDEALDRAGSSLLGELLASSGPPDPDPDAPPEPKVDLVAAFRAGRGTHALRVVLARTTTADVAPPRRPTVILERRNERCLDVLARELAAGKARIGIHYGAAHMAHLERRLVRDLGWTHVRDEWLCAWDNAAVPVDATVAAARASRAAPAHPLGEYRRRARRFREAMERERELHERRQRELMAQDPAPEPGRPGRIEGFTDLERHLERSRRTGREDWEAERLREQLASLQRDVAVLVAAGRTSRDTDRAQAAAGIAAATAHVRAAYALAAALAHVERRGAVPTLDALPLPEHTRRDPWGNALRLVREGSGLSVRSDGPDGVAGTGDDVVAASPR